MMRRTVQRLLGVGRLAGLLFAVVRWATHDKNDPCGHDIPLSKLVRQLRDPDPMVRCRAAHLIGHLGPEAKDAVPALIAALKDDKNSGLRYHAARALGDIGPAAKDALPALVIASKEDKDPAVRFRAAEAIERIDPEAAKKAGIP
jgi:HEAT repeat protein